jgi:hypothetical protein
MTGVAPAGPVDVPALAGPLGETGRFYGAVSPVPSQGRVRQINDALFSSPPAAHALLAWDGTQLVGVAVYSFLWPARASPVRCT